MATPTRLYTAHSRALTTLYSDLESYASQQREVFVGTAGTVLERANAAGFRFYVPIEPDPFPSTRPADENAILTMLQIRRKWSL